MAEILSTTFNMDTLRLFYDDIKNNDYYVFVSSVTTGLTDRFTAVDSRYHKNIFLENVVFGKKILTSDVHFAIKFYPWQSGQIFDEYRDDIDLSDKKFFATVTPTSNDTGDYRIYKCLSNNNGSAVANPPPYIANQPSQIYPTSDGYVWKFMYSLTEAEFEAYNSIGYIPIRGEFEIDPYEDANNALAISGSKIDQILVENSESNFGYISVDGGFTSRPTNQEFTIKPAILGGLEEIANYYAGMSIYVTNGLGQSNTYVISSYSYDTTNQQGRVTVEGNPASDGFNDNNSSFKIVPTIKIEGDGSGAQAIPKIVDGRITSILVLDPGNGYNVAAATVVDPLYDFNPEDPLSIDVRAQLKPVLSPPGGHGFSLIDEFKCRHVSLYAYITETDNNQIGATGSYSYLGIVKNPVFDENHPDIIEITQSSNGAITVPTVFDNRIALITDASERVIVGDTVTQVNSSNETVFSAVVHEVDYDANTVYITDYMGAYSNYTNNDISLDPDLPFRLSSGQILDINTPVANNIIESPYVQRSGKVYFMEDFFAIARTNASREEYKLVLEF